MIVGADYKAIEWQSALELSGDKVGIDEWNSGIDMHGVNQEKFKLPERRIAKIFLFRLIFGGTEWSYSKDPDYSWISDSPKYWLKIIEGFKEKYKGWDRWVENQMREVTRSGHLITPTGRSFFFSPKRVNGALVWPKTQIMNYPVQGTASDWVRTGRVVLQQKLSSGVIPGALLITSVHDSLVLDVPNEQTENACKVLHQVVHVDTMKVFSKLFNYKFSTNVKGEIFYGPNQSDLKEWKP